MQSATKISLVTLVVAVSALVLALWPVVADAPWDNGLTSEQIYETIAAETDTSFATYDQLIAAADVDKTEAERLAKCDAILRLVNTVNKQGGSADPLVLAEITRAVIENHC